MSGKLSGSSDEDKNKGRSGRLGKSDNEDENTSRLGESNEFSD